jgi:hypothetical protein
LPGLRDTLRRSGPRVAQGSAETKRGLAVPGLDQWARQVAPREPEKPDYFFFSSAFLASGFFSSFFISAFLGALAAGLAASALAGAAAACEAACAFRAKAARIRADRNLVRGCLSG